MMHGPEKSDSLVVPGKPANKAASAAAELGEGRSGTEGNAMMQSMVRTQSWEAVSQAQSRIREAVNRNGKEKLTALLHHIDVDVLRAGFLSLKKSASAGVDQMTWGMYEAALEENLQRLHQRLHAGAYRALPSRRVYIPKADGKQRPLGIAAMEDKIVQAATVMILTPIYEAEFLGFSYGFRPGRSQHDALDALAYGIKGRNIWWILDADISRFFDTINHEWLVKFMEHRIGDRRIIRLIQKWLKAGVLEQGARIDTSQGTPQGAVISPLLANIYLHYVYDLWVQAWRKRHADADMIVVRYADDTIVGFQYVSDAHAFLGELRDRLAKFGLSLHPEKTRLIAFGRFVAERRAAQGLSKPETFDFLGFTHICGKKRGGKGFQLWRKTKRKRKTETVKRIATELRHMRSSPIDEQGRWLAQVLRGHYAYFAVPTNLQAVRAVRHLVKIRWYLSLLRRSQRRRLTWRRMNVIVEKYLPMPRVLHPWPEQRFLVKHRR
ncbi:group II intron reverse transcriptase/maturase [Burkholderia humptydooensis]|uniref:Group II intron reverse transcriptase/maturase n=3 Tax=Burkholderiaceae TaxID=119060 RepID=A0A7U4P1R3_9BURK|nr:MULTISPECIES: group II intron reverse transcriptase/maturase [Burkholderia]AJY42467.1 group II intron reverse transcriptase/maturase [Burkholderia sp. 2002721687]ALX41381.1 group II intron reverse transcriptase/maturase [Burkholderia humptydooensis]QPS43457.1 group II intron reverse transcriptase/maturase [Burkholderia humptydooensis]